MVTTTTRNHHNIHSFIGSCVFLYFPDNSFGLVVSANKFIVGVNVECEERFPTPETGSFVDLHSYGIFRIRNLHCLFKTFFYFERFGCGLPFEIQGAETLGVNKLIAE